VRSTPGRLEIGCEMCSASAQVSAGLECRLNRQPMPSEVCGVDLHQAKVD
jgi:hypothetical protein